jgi:hypothetical protein
MNKQQIRNAAHAAIQRSDEMDVKRLLEGKYPELDRGWARLNSFLITFCTELASIDLELAKQLDAFGDRVMKNENPLLSAAPDMQEKSK